MNGSWTQLNRTRQTKQTSSFVLEWVSRKLQMTKDDADVEKMMT